MTELEKIQRAKMYIDKMANGINPIDDTSVKETDIINNVRISRCLFYVSEVLRQVIENNGTIRKTKTKKLPFHLSDENKKKFVFSSVPIPAREILKQLNELVDLKTCSKLTYTSISNWLISINALRLEKTSDEKNVKRPTKYGQELGISVEKRIGTNGVYMVVLYNLNAQQFIIDNLEAIITYAEPTNVQKATNQGQAWTQAHEECLIDLFNKNVPISEIAVTLMRTETGIRARLKKIGLIEN